MLMISLPIQLIKTIEQIKKTPRSELETQNLHLNKRRTEEYEVKRNENELWKECKLLGSL